MEEQRYVVMNCTFRGTVADWRDKYSEFYGIGNYPPKKHAGGCRAWDILHTLGLVGLHHLGLIALDSPETVMNRGFDVVVDYFCGDWWQSMPKDEWGLDKKKGREDMHWIASFTEGLLIGLLSERWDDAARVCGWVEPDLEHEYYPEYEEELVLLYKSLAAGLRPEPMSGLDRLEKKIMKCRTVRPKLLFQAWNAARSGNQSDFDKFLMKSLTHFLDNIEPNSIPLDWVALHSSTVCAAGRRLGMKFPELPPRLEAALMTRESLGLAPARR